MAEMATITRRAALVGALLSTAALAMPAVPAVAAILRPQSRLDELIGRHQAAYLHLDDCVAREMRIDDQLPSLRLAYGWVWDENTQAISRPLFISSSEQLRTLVRRQPQFQHLVPRWKALEQDYDELRRKAGLLDAIKVREAAEQAEEDARIALVVHRPVDATEAEAKAEYVRTSPPFRDQWHHDDTAVIDAMLKALCAPA